MRCDRCQKRVSKALGLEEMPNGDWVCRNCSEKETVQKKKKKPSKKLIEMHGR